MAAGSEPEGSKCGLTTKRLKPRTWSILGIWGQIKKGPRNETEKTQSGSENITLIFS